jgi:hypothetical protein
MPTSRTPGQKAWIKLEYLSGTDNCALAIAAEQIVRDVIPRRLGIKRFCLDNNRDAIMQWRRGRETCAVRIITTERLTHHYALEIAEGIEEELNAASEDIPYLTFRAAITSSDEARLPTSGILVDLRIPTPTSR